MEKSTPFEYAGHKFKLLECYEPGTIVCDLVVLSETEEGKQFLQNENYAYNAFITGRGVWLLKRKQELEELTNVKCKTVSSESNS